jgi:serine/threonine protein kinase
MVMDFVQGGDFFTFMRKVGKVRESWARLYITEISMALQHLHDQDIVYRCVCVCGFLACARAAHRRRRHDACSDLKPENVLMDASGHVKLTDFGESPFSLSLLTAATPLLIAALHRIESQL